MVLIAGKGHEHGQYVGGVVIPFDDREVAAAALVHRRAAEDATMTAGPVAAGWSPLDADEPAAARGRADDLTEPYPEDP